MYLKFIAGHFETDMDLQQYLLKFNVKQLDGIASSVEYVLRRELKN